MLLSIGYIIKINNKNISFNIENSLGNLMYKYGIILTFILYYIPSSGYAFYQIPFIYIFSNIICILFCLFK